jgi:hypothetical protein
MLGPRLVIRLASLNLATVAVITAREMEQVIMSVRGCPRRGRVRCRRSGGAMVCAWFSQRFSACGRRRQTSSLLGWFLASCHSRIASINSSGVTDWAGSSRPGRRRPRGWFRVVPADGCGRFDLSGVEQVTGGGVDWVEGVGHRVRGRGVAGAEATEAAGRKPEATAAVVVDRYRHEMPQAVWMDWRRM